MYERDCFDYIIVQTYEVGLHSRRDPNKLWMNVCVCDQVYINVCVCDTVCTKVCVCDEVRMDVCLYDKVCMDVCVCDQVCMHVGVLQYAWHMTVWDKVCMMIWHTNIHTGMSRVVAPFQLRMIKVCMNVCVCDKACMNVCVCAHTRVHACVCTLEYFLNDEPYVLQCVAVCCSVLQCVAVCCSVLQCVAMCLHVEMFVCTHASVSIHALMRDCVSVHWYGVATISNQLD